MAGGKLTTYRLMAEQTVDRIGRYLKTTLPKCRTADEPLLEAEDATFSSVLPPAFTREAVEHYCTYEWATHLDDIMLRRAGWHYYHENASDMAQQLAAWMKDILAWDADRCRSELERLRNHTL